MEPNPFAVGKLLSTLVDRPVQMARTDGPSFSTKVLFATYDVEPDGHTAVVKIDLSMLACLAGLMIGLPAKQVEAQVAKSTLDDDMTDASREVMNICSSVIVGEGRAIFREIRQRETDMSAAERQLLIWGGLSRTSMKCTISSQVAGFMTIVSSS